MPTRTSLTTFSCIESHQNTPADTAQIVHRGSASGSPTPASIPSNYGRVAATKCTCFLSTVLGQLPLLIILFVSTFLYACSPTILLYDDFNNNPSTGNPVKDIPGPPTGDLVEYADNVQQRLTVVSFTAVNSGKGLEFNSKPLDGLYGNNYLAFKGIQTGDFSKSIQFSLVGKFDYFTDELLITLSNGSALEFTRFTVQKDGTLAATIDYIGKNGQVNLCKLKPNLNYFFRFTVDMKKNLVNIGIFGDVTVDGRPQPSFVGEVALINNPLKNVTGPIRPSFGFQWSESANGLSKFTMTGLEIRQ